MTPELECPYCNSRMIHQEMREHPYPYKRGNSKHPSVDFLQYIRKFMCRCGNHFFYMMRVGSDMGLGNSNVYCQIYKQGHYSLKESDSLIITLKPISRRESHE